VPVSVAPAVRRDVPRQVESFGHVEAYRSVAITAQVGGVLKKVYFQEGQTVEQGASLFLIDPEPYRAALAAAEAKLSGDRVTAANLEDRVGRYDNLVKKDYITAQSHDDMVSQLRTARAAVQADSAQVVNARLDLDYCSISAPIRGRLGELLVDKGNVVKANGDNPLTVLHRLRPIYVRFTIPEQYLPTLLREFSADTVEVRANAPDEPSGAHVGRLTFVDNAVDEQTGTILLKAEFANEDEEFWPGEFVEVILVLEHLHDVVVVPARAVNTGQKGDYVFVVEPDSTVQAHSVDVRYRFGVDAVVDTGVDAGATVVTDGQLRLRPGSKISVRAAVEAKTAP
jgi:multidrug efflux system membrane fusion protein